MNRGSEEVGAERDPHRFDPAAADKLEDTERYRYLSRDELVEALDPDSEDRIADIGSGTGFYSRDLASFVERVVAVDLQPAMHGAFRSAGLPPNVIQVLAKADSLPFVDAAFDGLFSTMTLHEFDRGAPTELYRVLASDGRLVVVDWSGAGAGERGPPLESRLEPATAADLVEGAGFEVIETRSRPETFVIVGLKP